MIRVALEPVTYDPKTSETFKSVLKLKVSPQQERFVASNAISIAEAYFVPEHWFRAITADGVPAGFVMVHKGVEDGFVFLWRLMVDARCQGQGIAWRGMQLVFDEVRTWSGVRGMRVSYVEGEGGPEGFYRRLGFKPTGRLNDDETEAELLLASNSFGFG